MARNQLRMTASLDVIRKRSSFTPMEASKDKWVEADRTLAKKLLATVEDARRNANLKVSARPLPIASAGTGFSQYFLGPSLSSSASSPELRDLFLLRTNIPRSLLADELRERSAAHHYWTVLHPLQLAHDMASIADSTVFTVKLEGVHSVPLPTLLRGIQDAVSLSFDHLEEMCARSLTKAIQAKVAIREFLLGALKSHTLRDPLLASDLIHPTIFAPAALEAAVPILKAAMDAHAVRDHAGRVPFASNNRSFTRRRTSPGLRQGASLPPRQWAQPPPASPSTRPCLRSRIGVLQLARFAPRWSDAPSLPATTVWRGFHWTWASDPPALRFPSSTQRQPDLREPILDLVTKGVVVPVPDEPCFLSRLFAVPRPDNRPPRLIIDMSRLNDYIVAPPFSLNNHSTLAKLLSPPAFMASLDIAEAYTHIPMRPNLRRYLAFSYMGRCSFFTCFRLV